TAGSVGSLARWFYHIDQLRRRGLICRSLYADGDLLATLVPLSPFPVAPSPGAGRNGSGPPANVHRPWKVGSNGAPEAANAPFILSRFAYLRREGRKLVLESPLVPARLILHDPRAMAVIGGLGEPVTIADLAGPSGALADDAIRELVALLIDANMVDRVDAGASAENAEPAEGAPAVAGNPALEFWEFHDLLFHARSRRGRSDGRFGGTCRFAARRPPPPALMADNALEWCDLHRPDLERLERKDPPLALVQNRRRSIREYAAEPMTMQQLGEFLYRVARMTRYWQTEIPAPAGPIAMEFTSRPYPAGGGLHELEFYTVINACQGLDRGLYHYDPQQHRLGRLSRPTRETGMLLKEAAASAGIAPETLQVHVILAARFERLSWKYESIAYSLILKDVGVIYQTMYLAATAMGLAPCALGCGDSDLFARAAGTDYYVETSVGEFLLGSQQ
ncbi:MAG: SagB family peptide dehydrogenase, partial [Deltaproteobacteria bacterium]